MLRPPTARRHRWLPRIAVATVLVTSGLLAPHAAADGSPAVTVELAPAAVLATGSSGTVVTATVTAGDGSALAGEDVVVTVDGGQQVGPVTAGGQAGQYRATITSSAQPGSYTVTVTDESQTPPVSGTASLSQLAVPPARPATALLWGNHGSETIDSTAGGATPVVTGTSPNGLATDGTYVYWANVADDAIGRARLDGTDAEPDFVAAGTGSFPAAVAVDGTSIYWTDPGNGTIGRAGIDGSGPTDSFVTGLTQPYGIAVDDSHVYWSDSGSATIGSAALDGSDVNPDLVTLDDPPVGLAVAGGQLFWTDAATGSIGSAGTDGSAVDANFLAAGNADGLLSTDGTYLYWIEFDTGGVGRATLDGTDVQPGFLDGADLPTGVAAVTRPRPTVSVQVDPVPADGTSTTTATVTVTDAGGAPVAGDTAAGDDIRIAVDGGQQVGPVVAGPDPGTYRATITATTGAGPFTVTATDRSVAPEATATAPLEQTPVAQSIDFPAPAATYGQAPFSPATATSGLPVSYSDAAGSCTLGTDGLVHVTAAGACTVTASQPGDGQYAPADPVTRTITVAPATLHVDADPATTVQGAPDPTPTGTLRAADLVNGDTPASVGAAGTAACVIAAHPDTVGTYPGAITCTAGTLSAADYTVVPGTAADLLVTQAPPKVTGVSPTILAGTGGTVTVTGTGFVHVSRVTLAQGGAGSIVASKVTVQSPTTLTATFPQGSLIGKWHLMVRTTVGQSPMSSVDQVLVVPAITAVAPNQGPTSGGTVVDLHGAGFGAGDKVYVAQGSGVTGRLAATSVTVVSPSEITATMPGGALAGRWHVYVLAPIPYGYSLGTSADMFRYVAG